jgi:hypothetical protein
MLSSGVFLFNYRTATLSAGDKFPPNARELRALFRERRLKLR